MPLPSDGKPGPIWKADGEPASQALSQTRELASDLGVLVGAPMDPDLHGRTRPDWHGTTEQKVPTMPDGGCRPGPRCVWAVAPAVSTPHHPTRTRQDLPCTSAGRPRASGNPTTFLLPPAGPQAQGWTGKYKGFRCEHFG
jgi:hypothetical protein